MKERNYKRMIVNTNGKNLTIKKLRKIKIHCFE